MEQFLYIVTRRVFFCLVNYCHCFPKRSLETAATFVMWYISCAHPLLVFMYSLVRIRKLCFVHLWSILRRYICTGGQRGACLHQSKQVPWARYAPAAVLRAILSLQGALGPEAEIAEAKPGSFAPMDCFGNSPGPAPSNRRGHPRNLGSGNHDRPIQGVSRL